MVIHRDKIIRRIGDSVGVIFNKEERTLFNIQVNDKVNIQMKNLNETEEETNEGDEK